LSAFCGSDGAVAEPEKKCEYKGILKGILKVRLARVEERGKRRI